MKVIFLDFDGVINSNRTAVGYGRFPINLPEDTHLFDWVAIRLLQKLNEYPEVKFVISSTWRLYYSIEELRNFLAVDIIGVTPLWSERSSLPYGAVHSISRGEQIQLWLDYAEAGEYNYVNWDEDPVTHYCIIDDDPDILDSQNPSFVQTTMQDGLLMHHYLKVLEILELKNV